VRRSLACGALIAVLVLAVMRPAAAQAPQDLEDRAESAFAQGRLADAVAGFDALATLVPSVAPYLWERGVALYFLGQYDQCAAQFASYHAIDAHDLENASWLFLCRARAASIDQARATQPPAGPDPRVMRTEIYDLFRGKLTPDEVLDAAGDTAIAQFYAHVYVGLYLELMGDRAGARQQLLLASSERYREYGGFMNVVARVHARALE
jgi:lipoprotein NlpI